MAEGKRFHAAVWLLLALLVVGTAAAALVAVSAEYRFPSDTAGYRFRSGVPRDKCRSGVGVCIVDSSLVDGVHDGSLRTREPELLYLGRAQPGTTQRQIFLLPAEDGGRRQLTDHPTGVWDFAVHPQGAAIAYSLGREDGGSDLWLMDRAGDNPRLLWACPGMACLSVAWSPDSQWLAYEKRGLHNGEPDLDPQASRIWLLDLETGKERSLFDYEVALYHPIWAPAGQRLAYLSPLLPGLEVYDLPTGELWQIPSEWGAVPAWSPDGSHLILPELSFAGEAIGVQLLQIDLASKSAAPIGATDEFYRDDAPAWSPDGAWIAFGRQFIDQERRTPGRQLWRVQPDGQHRFGTCPEGHRFGSGTPQCPRESGTPQAQPLVAVPMADLYGFAWRPDGAALAYLQVDLSQGFQPAPNISVWIFDLERGQPLQVADDGLMPRWLP